MDLEKYAKDLLESQISGTHEGDSLVFRFANSDDFAEAFAKVTEDNFKNKTEKESSYDENNTLNICLVDTSTKDEKIELKFYGNLKENDYRLIISKAKED